MLSKNEIGKHGESVACKFLKKEGYKILARNKHESHQEIDIIASNRDYIAFVEVKTRSVDDDLFNPYGTPASAVTPSKQERLISAARSYLRENPTNKQPRMDVVEVYLKKGTKDVLKINHFENAYHAQLYIIN